MKAGRSINKQGSGLSPGFSPPLSPVSDPTPPSNEGFGNLSRVPWQDAKQHALTRESKSHVGSKISEWEAKYQSGTIACQMGSKISQSVDAEHLNPEGTLEDWLAEQRRLVERTLALNTAITKRLAMESQPKMNVKKTSASNHPENQSRPLVKVSAADLDPNLSKPLLSECDTDVDPGTPRSPRGHRDAQTLRASKKGRKSAVEADSKKSTTDMHLRESSRERTSDIQVGEPVLLRQSSKGNKRGSVSEVEGMSEFMFPTLAGMKQHVMSLVSKPSQRVEDSYSAGGIWSSLAKHPYFANGTLAVIALNTLWIAIDTDYNKADLLAEADWQFQFMDNFFCAFFSIEMFIRFMAFKTRRNAFTDLWFLFDGFLVGLMIWETWITTLMYKVGYAPTGASAGAASVLRVFRIFRLLRIARTARLFKRVPELMILAQSMFVAMRSVAVILSFLALIIYIFAIIFTQLLEESTQDWSRQFKSVWSTANFLMLQVLCGFDPDFAAQLLSESVLCYCILILYLLLGSLTLMNMLIGILCDVVFTVSDNQKEENLEREICEKVEALAHELDANGDGAVSGEEFTEAMDRPEFLVKLSNFGVDVPALLDFAYYVFQENEELSYANFHHMVVQFRGGKAATLKDIMDMRKQISIQLSTIVNLYEDSNHYTTQLYQKMENMNNDMLQSGSDQVPGKLVTAQMINDELLKGGSMLDGSDAKGLFGVPPVSPPASTFAPEASLSVSLSGSSEVPLSVDDDEQSPPTSFSANISAKLDDIGNSFSLHSLCPSKSPRPSLPTRPTTTKTSLTRLAAERFAAKY